MLRTEEHRRLYVAVPKLWCDFKPCLALKVPTSLMFLYLGKAFVDGRDPSLVTISGDLYRVVCAHHWVMVLRALLASAFSPSKLAKKGF